MTKGEGYQSPVWAPRALLLPSAWEPFNQRMMSEAE